MKNNSSPESQKQAYIRPKALDIKKGTRNQKLKGWKFCGEYNATVNKIIDNNQAQKGRKKEKAVPINRKSQRSNKGDKP